MRSFLTSFLFALSISRSSMLNSERANKAILSARKQHTGGITFFLTTGFDIPEPVTPYLKTAPPRPLFVDDCDYLINQCMEAYNTSKICGRTIMFEYKDFDSYCIIDWLNCRLRYEVWQFAYVGACATMPDIEINYNVKHDLFAYTDDPWLDETYVDIQDDL